MKIVKSAALASAMVLCGSSAFAIPSSYDVGLRAGMRHGVKNPECYARVFANYTRWYPNARIRGWNFPLRNLGTAHAAFWNECGIAR